MKGLKRCDKNLLFFFVENGLRQEIDDYLSAQRNRQKSLRFCANPQRGRVWGRSYPYGPNVPRAWISAPALPRKELDAVNHDYRCLEVRPPQPSRAAVW